MAGKTVTEDEKSKAPAEKSAEEASGKSPKPPEQLSGLEKKPPKQTKLRKTLVRAAILFAVVYAGVFFYGQGNKTPAPSQPYNSYTDQSGGANSAGPAPDSPANQGAGDQLAQLQAQRDQLSAMLQQCSQGMVDDTRRQALIASGIDPGPAPPQMSAADCNDQRLAEWGSQIAVLDARINRAQGIPSTPCSVWGSCNGPTPSGGGSPAPYASSEPSGDEPSDSPSGSGNGQSPAWNYSEQGILGQGHFVGADGTDFTESLQSRYYYRVPYTNDVVGTELDQPPDADHTERLTPQQ